jgi:hypothetical protein
VRHSAVVRPASERTVYQTLALKRAEISRLPTDIAKGTDGSPFGAAAAISMAKSARLVFPKTVLQEGLDRHALAGSLGWVASDREFSSNHFSRLYTLVASFQILGFIEQDFRPVLMMRSIYP